MNHKNLKPLPTLTNDAEAEDFVASSNLTKFDLSGGRVKHFEFEEKDSQLNLRVPTRLLNALKRKAKLNSLPYARYIRMLIEQDLSTK